MIKLNHFSEGIFNPRRYSGNEVVSETTLPIIPAREIRDIVTVIFRTPLNEIRVSILISFVGNPCNKMRGYLMEFIIEICQFLSFFFLVKRETFTRRFIIVQNNWFSQRVWMFFFMVFIGHARFVDNYIHFYLQTNDVQVYHKLDIISCNLLFWVFLDRTKFKCK